MLLKNGLFEKLSPACRTKTYPFQDSNKDTEPFPWRQMRRWQGNAKWNQILATWQIAHGAGIWIFLSSPVGSRTYLRLPNPANWHRRIWYHLNFQGFHTNCQAIVPIPVTWKAMSVRTWTDPASVCTLDRDRANDAQDSSELTWS